QYASASSNNWNSTALSGSILPGSYYLIAEKAGTGCSGSPCGNVLPASNVADTTNLNGSDGKVVLFKTPGAIGAISNPLADASTSCLVVDLVGYGSANAFEGANPAPEPVDETKAAARIPVCSDNDNNIADFISADTNPHAGDTAVAADLD